MQKLCDTSAKQQSMMEDMAAAGMQPNVTTYTTLVNQLMFEGNFGEARAVVETEMPAAGVVPNDRTHAVFERLEETWSRMRTKRLHDLTETRTPEARQQAQTFFEVLKVNGVANVFLWTFMQKLCDTSAEQRVMMGEMTEAGVEPNVVTYGTLVKQLMLEGNFEEARAVVETEMPAARVVPDDRTQSVLEKPEEVWSRMRTTHLQSLLKRGTPEARQQAQEFFEGLKVSSVANGFQFSVMMKPCNTSAEQRIMMAEMVEAGVEPNVAIYDTVVSQLMLEGNFEEARAVVEMQMPAAGVVPDDRMHALFERSEREWNTMRTKHLQGLLHTSTAEARQQADNFFEGLKANRAASVFHWTFMQKLCDTSANQQSMMEEMAEAGVEPNVATYGTLVKQLMIEGKYQEARAVVKTEMPAARVVPDNRTKSVFEKPEEVWSRMRTTHLQSLLKRGTPEARQQAQEFFEVLKVNGVANGINTIKA